MLWLATGFSKSPNYRYGVPAVTAHWAQHALAQPQRAAHSRCNPEHAAIMWSRGHLPCGHLLAQHDDPACTFGTQCTPAYSCLSATTAGSGWRCSPAAISMGDCLRLLSARCHHPGRLGNLHETVLCGGGLPSKKQQQRVLGRAGLAGRGASECVSNWGGAWSVARFKMSRGGCGVSNKQGNEIPPGSGRWYRLRTVVPGGLLRAGEMRVGQFMVVVQATSRARARVRRTPRRSEVEGAKMGWGGADLAVLAGC